MSKRNRGKLFATVTAIAATTFALLSAILIWDVAQSQAENRVRAQRYADKYAAEAKQEISNTCTDPATLAKCVVEIIDATHEHQRAEADLAAQRDMADYALAMFVVTSASILVGLIGVFFVWQTLRATRKANKIARKSAERQLRAYVQVNKISLGLVKGQPDITAVGVDIRNTGQTPAEIIEYGWEISPGDYDQDWERPTFSSEAHRSTLGVGQKTTLYRAIILDDIQHDVLYVYGTIRFRDVFKNTRNVEFTRMLLRPADAGGHWDTRQVRRGPNYSE